MRTQTSTVMWRFFVLFQNQLNDGNQDIGLDSGNTEVDNFFVIYSTLTDHIGGLALTIEDFTAVMEEAGMSQGKYIDNMIFLKAKQMLSDPALTIGQISQKLGFCDQFIFPDASRKILDKRHRSTGKRCADNLHYSAMVAIMKID